jgi:hypothetical protein
MGIQRWLVTGAVQEISYTQLGNNAIPFKDSERSISLWIFFYFSIRSFLRQFLSYSMLFNAIKYD